MTAVLWWAVQDENSTATPQAGQQRPPPRSISHCGRQPEQRQPSILYAGKSFEKNDMKHYFQNNAWSIGQGVAQLLHLIQTYPYAPNYSAPKVLVVSPIHIGPDVAHSPFGSFQPEAIEISKGLAAEMQRVAEQAGCAFFDAAAVAGPCDEDSIHMDAANHAALARALEPLVHELLD